MTDPDDLSQGQSFISHLLELRDRLLRMIMGVLLLLLALFPFANDLYHFVAAPLINLLPSGAKMIAIQVGTPFLTPFKLSLVAAVFLAMPWILYQFWAFVAPGLYQHEKRLAVPLLVASTLLFYLGMTFAYFLVLPVIFSFMVGVTPEGVSMMTDIAAYLDFVLALFFAFGVAFEVPVATFLLVVTGVVTTEALIEKRPYVIVGAFVVGMVLTPPDVVSQTLLAIPMWLLFEAGVFFARVFLRSPAPVAVPEPPVVHAPEPVSPPTRQADEPPRYVPLTKEEMEAELDALEAAGGSENNFDDPTPSVDAIKDNLKHANELRLNGNETLARDLLYEVLRYGDDKQIEVARNILRQMDED
jgi:sec-independent protein translocase protein TatC